jgi:uncharacterized membrane protein YkvA (DUF1232 family)
MGLLDRWKQAARRLKLETVTLYYAYRNPKTPWYAKVWGAMVVAYVLSPVDLIPDFIPIIGYLDDLVLVPIGIAVAIRLIPKEIYKESKALAREQVSLASSHNWIVGGMIIAIWTFLAACVAYLVIRKLTN